MVVMWWTGRGWREDVQEWVLYAQELGIRRDDLGTH
jgi:hypothetical protein